jgi:hypothetical protein
VRNVSERNNNGNAIVFEAAITPSWESATRPRIAPNPQNNTTASATNGTSNASAGVTGRVAPVSPTTNPRMRRLATLMTPRLTNVWAASHSPRVSGVVASFSNRLSSRWRAISEPIRDNGVKRTTVARYPGT